MPSRFVKQPNGLLAVFSTIVDTFTSYDLTEAEALAVARDEWRSNDPEGAVSRGVNDALFGFGTQGECGDGTHRWKEALDTIRAVHGKEKLRETLVEMGVEP